MARGVVMASGALRRSMCGRYTLFTPQSELEERFGARAERDLRPRYNCAPGQRLPIVADDEPDAVRLAKWGFSPSWADEEFELVNARAETIHEKNSFRAAFERRRCLVLADGFYEWAETGNGKQPYRVAFPDDRPFAMAGIWERWSPPEEQTGLDDFGVDAGDEGGSVETFAVVTTEPNAVVRDLHDRMAAMLAPDEEERWLRGDPEEARALLDPYPPDELRAYPVSKRVNNPATDAPDLVEEVGG